MSPPSLLSPPSPIYCSLINDRLYQSTTTGKLRVDRSKIVYLPTRRSDLILILSCMILNFLSLSFSTLQSSSLWRTDTIVVFKLNKPPYQISPPSLLSPPTPSNGLEINKPPGELNRGFTVINFISIKAGGGLVIRCSFFFFFYRQMVP